MNSWSRLSTDVSRSRFSLPEYFDEILAVCLQGLDTNGNQTYSRSHLLPPLLVLYVVRLGEDIVPPILDAAGVIVPIRAFVSGLVVDVSPDCR